MKFLKICIFLVLTPSFVYGDVWRIKVTKVHETVDPNFYEEIPMTYQEKLEAIDNFKKNENDRNNEKIQESLNKGDNTGKSKK